MGKIETKEFLDKEELERWEKLQNNKRGYIWQIYARTNRIGPGPGKHGSKAARRAKNKVARRQRAVNR